MTPAQTPSSRRSRRPPSLFTCLLLVLLTLPGLWLLTATPATAQGSDEAGSEPSETFYEAVDVNVVNLEVYVTDEDGNPVAGLTQEDFELYEDGERVEITNFYAVDDGDLTAFQPGAPAAREPAGSEGAVEPAGPPPEERRLYLVIYVDQMNITPPQRNRVLEGLELMLEERVTRGDKVAVVSSSPGFEILQPFTDERGKVLAAVEEAQKRTTGRLAVAKRQLELSLDRAADTSDPVLRQELADQALNSIRLYAAQMEQRMRTEMAKLRGFTSALAGLPGRKAVVHLSEGVPVRPAEDLFYLWGSLFGGPDISTGDGFSGPEIEASRYDLGDQLTRLVEDANAAGVTFYTLDAMGPRANFSVSAESRGLTAGGSRVGGIETEATAAVNSQSALQQMAGGTGGVPVLNANRPWRDFEQVARSFDTWYSLGYVADEREPGKYRRLEVEVDQPGLKVRHRQGTQDLSSAERVENQTVAALLLERWSNPLRVFVEPGEAEKTGRRRYSMPLEVKVPLERVTLLPGPGSHRGLLRVRVAFQDLDGTDFGVGEETLVPIEIPDGELEQARSGHYTVKLDLTLQPGPRRLTVGVWDEVSAVASFVPYDVTVGEGTGPAGGGI